MIIQELTFTKPDGLSVKNAQAIVLRAMRYNSSICFEFLTRKINAKSLMGVISMGLKHNDKFMIIISGDDQENAFADLKALFESNFI